MNQVIKKAKRFWWTSLVPSITLGAVQPSPVTVINPTTMNDFSEFITNVINFFIGFVGAVAVLYLMWSGFKYVMAGGDGKKVGEAKEGIKNAVVGIVIVIVSYLIVQIVVNQLAPAKKNIIGEW